MKKDENQVELSPAFKEALGKLQRQRQPSPELEDRMVRAMRLLGLVQPDATAFRKHWYWPGAFRIAASIAVFAGGVLLGHTLGSQPKTTHQVSAAESTPWDLAAQVQKTGSSHAAALGMLANRVATARPDEVDLAREVALASLRAALQQMALLDPSDPTPARLLDELHAAGLGGPMPIRMGDEPWLVWF